MFNSLIVKVESQTYVFECHSYSKAVEILASHWNLWNEQDLRMNTNTEIESFELV